MTTITDDLTRPIPDNRRLAPPQMAILITTGIVLWFCAAMLLRALGPTGAFAVPAVFLLYAAIIALTAPFVPLVRIVASLRGDQVGVGVTIVTATASLCDANALVLMPSLYGNDPAYVLGASAALLWGIGVALFLGLVMNRHSRD